jgi:hypothetical protein
MKQPLVTAVLLLMLLAGCGGPKPQESPSPSAPDRPAETISAGPSQTPSDSVASASLVNTAEMFEKAISKDGTWIVCLLSDLTIDKELVVDGDFLNNKTPPKSQRKLAFYEQDADRNVTARYTLTAPKMTINSSDCAIWNGTFRGDLYVAGKNFQLIGATVDGNLYFLNDEAQASFAMDENSSVTGLSQLVTPPTT